MAQLRLVFQRNDSGVTVRADFTTPERTHELSRRR